MIWERVGAYVYGIAVWPQRASRRAQLGPAGLAAPSIPGLTPMKCPTSWLKKGASAAGPGCSHQPCPNTVLALPFTQRPDAGGCCLALLQVSIIIQVLELLVFNTLSQRSPSTAEKCMNSNLHPLFIRPCPPGEIPPFAGNWLVTSSLGQGLRALLTRGVAAELVPDVLVCSQMCWCLERDAPEHQRNPEVAGEAHGNVNPMPATTATPWADVPAKSKWNLGIFQNKIVVFPRTDLFSIRKALDGKLSPNKYLASCTCPAPWATSVSRYKNVPSCVTVLVSEAVTR